MEGQAAPGPTRALPVGSAEFCTPKTLADSLQPTDRRGNARVRRGSSVLGNGDELRLAWLMDL
jgi:hypothetical protein